MNDERRQWTDQDQEEYERYHAEREAERRREPLPEGRRDLPTRRAPSTPARRERTEDFVAQTREDRRSRDVERYKTRYAERWKRPGPHQPDRREKVRMLVRAGPRMALHGIGSWVMRQDADHRKRRESAGGRVDFFARGFFHETRSYRRQMSNPFSMSSGRSGGMNPYLVGDLFQQTRRGPSKRRRGSRRAQTRRSEFFPGWL